MYQIAIVGAGPAGLSAAARAADRDRRAKRSTPSYVLLEGFNAHATVEWVGDRFLNRRNTVLAPSYTEWGAGIGYRFPRWEVRLDGDNLGDERAAVSESELGDAQFYRLPARSLRLTASARF